MTPKNFKTRRTNTVTQIALDAANEKNAALEASVKGLQEGQTFWADKCAEAQARAEAAETSVGKLKEKVDPLEALVIDLKAKLAEAEKECVCVCHER